MRDPRSLYELERRRPGAARAAARRGADRVRRRRLRRRADDRVPARRRSTRTVVATFDADELLDYRARRPIIFFQGDHLTDYRPPRLSLDLARDEIGQQFLLLTGYEPDFQWERFTAAVLGLIDALEVSSTTWVNSIPMPVPHTRPIGVTVSGNRTDLIEAMSIWRPTHAGAVERAAPRRVPPAGAGASDGGVRAAHPALPLRHRVPARPRSPRSRAISASTGPDLPDRRAARAGPRVRRPHRRAGRRERRAREARRHARGAPRLLHGGHDAARRRSPTRTASCRRPTRSRPSSRSSWPTGARATTTPRSAADARGAASGNAPGAPRVVIKRGERRWMRGSQRTIARTACLYNGSRTRSGLLVRHVRAVQADLTWVLIVSENDRAESTSRRPMRARAARR